MKKFSLYILLFIVSTLSAQAQIEKSGSRYIQQARGLIESDQNTKKALRLLKKAEKFNYGQCGNAWFDAFGQIHYLRATIFFKHEAYQESLEELEEIVLTVASLCQRSDSLKVENLIKLYGKEKVKSMLWAQAHTEIPKKELFINHQTCINLTTIEYEFCFKSLVRLSDLEGTIAVDELLRATTFYAILNED